MKLRKIICILLSLFMLTALLACEGDSGETRKLTVSEVTHSVFYAPQYAAIALGFFEDEGLDIELVNGGGADNVMTAVLSGQVDIGFAGPEACIYVVNEGKAEHPRVFAQLTKRDGSFIISREKSKNFDYSEMKGARLIGGRAGGVPYMTLKYVLNEYGLTENDLNIDTSIEFNNMVAAFTGGIGDYVTAFEPTASLLEAQGAGYVVASVGADSGEIPYTAYFAGSELIKKEPQTIAAFTRAIYRAQQWIAEADSAEIARTIAPFFDDTDEELLISAIDRYRQIDAWSADPLLTEDSLNNLMNVMEFSGELSERPAYENVVYTDAAREVMK